jgi:putative DNA primase/helicase
MLTAALWYARVALLYVFPVFEPVASGCSCGDRECQHPGKHPRAPHGYLDATRDERQIIEWWDERWPNASIGVACGASGLIVLDNDVRNGGFASHADLIEHMQKKYGVVLPESLTVMTGSNDGSTHDYFRYRWTDGDRTPSALEPGLDLKGQHGFVIAPPSRHYKGGVYTVNGMAGAKAFLQIAEAPEKMMALVRNGSRQQHDPREDPEEKWTKGVRNNKLFKLACSLRGRGMTVEEITTILLATNSAHCTPPLSAAEIADIALSSGRYERWEPPRAEQTAPGKTEYAWPEPQPLPGELPPVEEFDPALLPESMCSLVIDVSERMQVPADFAAATLVLCLAGAVNRRATIQPKAQDASWIVVPNLWGGIVAAPGFLKSPIIQATTRPLQKIQALWRQEYEGALACFQEEQEQAELRKAAWKELFKAASKAGNAPPIRPDDTLREPTLKRLIINDSTFEALHQTMAENPAGILVIRDELTGWWSQLDRPGREGERAFYLEGWNGDTSRTVDRIERGHVHVDACCISMGGGIQPARLRFYLSDALQDNPNNDGLIQRFQVLVWPDPPHAWEYVDRRPDARAIAQIRSLFEKLTGLDAEAPLRLRFAPGAQELFIAWLTELEAKIRGGDLHPALTAHLSKYRSLMPTLAGLCALADAAALGRNIELVELPYAQLGAAWCEYLESHARRVYSCIASPQVKAMRDLGDKIRQRKLGADGFFTLRDLYLKGWSGMDSPESAKVIVTMLEEAGWVRDASRRPGITGGRPSLRYQISPRLWG